MKKKDKSFSFSWNSTDTWYGNVVSLILATLIFLGCVGLVAFGLGVIFTAVGKFVTSIINWF